MITAERAKELFSYDPDTGTFVWKADGRPAFTSKTTKGYPVGSADGKKYYAHRMAWLITHGVWPKGQIDHINGQCADNRLINLRDIPAAENQKNMKRSRRNVSGIVGVYYIDRLRKWGAYIRANGKMMYCGVYPTKEEAAAVRKQAEMKYGFHPNHGNR